MISMRITGAASSQLLLRVINLFAQRDLALSRIEAHMEAQVMHIRIDLRDGASHATDVVAEKLQVLVGVQSVSLEYQDLHTEPLTLSR